MSEEKIIKLTKKQALECMIIKDNKVHNFIQAGFGLVGADYTIKEVKKKLDEADSIEIGGEGCKALSHRIVVLKNEKAYFFEADNQKLDKYEV